MFHGLQLSYKKTSGPNSPLARENSENMEVFLTGFVFYDIFSKLEKYERERYREFPLHTQVSINHLWGVLINFDTFFSLSSFSYFSSFLHRVLPCSERMKSGSEFIAFSSIILQTFPVLETFQKFVVFRVWRKYFSLSPIHLVIQKT